MARSPRLICLLFLAVLWMLFAARAEAISFRYAAIGYHPQGAKVVILEDVPEGQEIKAALYDPTRRNPRFPVLLGATVYKIDNAREFRSKDQQGPGLKNIILDFSAFQEPGTYEIRLEDTDIKSSPIRISDYLYWDTLKPIVKTFYFQRCGQEVEDRERKIFHAACHLHDADLLKGASSFGDEEVDVVGGWHNGGDYAKYVTSVALSAAKLMAMQEWNPKPFRYFRLDYPLSEPGMGGLDDLHHEVKAGLDWLLAMQRGDGSFYRKVAGKQWPGKIAPDEDEQPRYIYGPSTQDTANVAAVLAMASRSFRKVDLGYSIKGLRAAEKAWDYLEAHPQPAVARSDSDFSGSGEFLDPQAANDISYRLWAAAELYVSTGKPRYHQAFLRHLKDVPLQRFSWLNPALQGATDYLFYASAKDAAAAASIKTQVLTLAKGIAADVDVSVWPSGLKQYPKSSNQEVAERAAVLLAAYKLSGDGRYRDAASRSVSYLFGLNPLGVTYITGLEGKSVSNPAHRWMEATGKLIPGYLVGGPNEFALDGKTPKGFGVYSYVDHAAATGVNESTLLDNASLAYLLGVLNDTYNVGKDMSGSPETPTPSGLPELPQLPVK